MKMNNRTIKELQIVFIGKDYSPLLDAVKSIRIFDDKNSHYVPDTKERCFIQTPAKDAQINSKEQYRVSYRILRKFLDSEMIANEKGELNPNLVVNRKEKNNRGKTRFIRKDLFDLSRGKDGFNGYFQGIVGTLKAKVIMTGEEVFGYNKLEEQYIFDIRLHIYSRMDYSDTNNRCVRPFFLSTLLLNGKLNLGNYSVPADETQLLDYLLVFDFKDKLIKACSKGYYRRYKRFEKNDGRLKGAINVKEHIRMNAGLDNGKIAYTNRENTVINEMNQMIILTYNHLKSKYRILIEENIDSDIRAGSYIRYLKNEIGYFSKNTRDIIEENLRPISHPLYFEYEELRKICIRILRDERTSFFGKDNSNVAQGILFYLPDLWELFVKNNVLNLLCHGTSYKYEMEKEITTFGTKDDSRIYTFSQITLPDYVFYYVEHSEQHPFLILDAKFKPAWNEVALSILNEKKKTISIGEWLLKDYDKCIRDMIDLGVNATGVIFPATENKTQSHVVIEHRISQEDEVDRFLMIPIVIPKVTDEKMEYSNWEKLLGNNINKIVADGEVGLKHIANRQLQRTKLDRKYKKLVAEEFQKRNLLEIL